MASFFALCAGHYLNHIRPTDEALLRLTQLLSESGLKTTQKIMRLKTHENGLKNAFDI